MDWRIALLVLASIPITYGLTQIAIGRSNYPYYAWFWVFAITFALGGIAFYLGTENKVKYKTPGDCDVKIVANKGGISTVKSGDCENLEKIYLNGSPLN